MRRWYFALAWIVHYFSLNILPKTLFSPWKRLVSDNTQPGFSLQRFFEEVSFNIISRCIGAFVRTIIFITGVLILISAIIAGLFGLVIWFVCPFVGIPYYFYGLPFQSRQVPELYKKIQSTPDILSIFFNSVPGKFMLTHLGVTSDRLPPVNPEFKLKPLSDKPGGLLELIKQFIEGKIWPETELKKMGFEYQDLETLAHWWDSQFPTIVPPEKLHFNRPGIGLELLFGFTPKLNQSSYDLSLPQPYSHHLIGREEIVNRIERVLSSDSNVILTGDAGVGKKTVVLEFARRAMAGELGKKLAYQRVLEFDYNFILSEGLDISRKKIALSQVLSEANQAGNIILVFKDLHRLVHSDVEGLDLTDVFESFLERRKLKIIAISTPTDYERFLSANTRLRKYFDIVEVTESTVEQAKTILLDSANFWEKERRLTFTVQSLRAILEDCDKYITETPYPEKALEILDKVVSYAEKNDKEVIFPEDINVVISEITGINLTRITESEKNLLVNLEDVMHQYLIGQDPAVDLISKSLRSSSVGAKDDKRPIGSFLFLGPTGVGKTQAAKALAKVYYGDEKQILRFDMAEYAGDEGFNRLIGNSNKNIPGTLASAIKNKPASLLLLDEIEKAPPLIINLFLSILDEGQFTDAFGHKIVCRHLFIIATSNAGAETIRQLVSQNITPEELSIQTIDAVQKDHIFSPEFINRFDGVVVFQPLAENQLKDIAKLLLTIMQKSLKKRNLYFQVTDEICQIVAQKGYSPQFGARPIRRLIDIELGDAIGKAVLSGKLKEGDKFTLKYSQKEGFYVAD